MLGLGPAGSVGGQRDAPRRQPAPRQRYVRRDVRHVSRSAKRVCVLHQPARRAGRSDLYGRRQSESRLELGVGGSNRPIRRRLDRGNRHSVQVAALHVGSRSDVGRQFPARHPSQERVGAPHCAAGGAWRVDGLVSRVGRRDARGPGSSDGEQEHRDQAVRHFEVHDRSHARVARRPRRRLRRRREVRHHRQPHRRYHLQHRFRPGRSRRAAGESHEVSPQLSREARLFSRGPWHLRLRAGRHSTRRRHRHSGRG